MDTSRPAGPGLPAVRPDHGLEQGQGQGQGNAVQRSPPTMQPLQAQPRPGSGGSGTSLPVKPIAPRPFQPALGVSPIHYRPKATNAVAGPGPSSLASATIPPNNRPGGTVQLLPGRGGGAIGRPPQRPIGAGVPAVQPKKVVSLASGRSQMPIAGKSGDIGPLPPGTAKPTGILPSISSDQSRATFLAGSSAPSIDPTQTAPSSSSQSLSSSPSGTKRKLSTSPKAPPARTQGVIGNGTTFSQDVPSPSSALASKGPSRSTGSGPGGSESKNGAETGEPGRSGERETKRKKKEAKKEIKKARACIYCRRSHMVCDATRPCARCNKRGIEHLCIADAKVAGYELDPTKPGEVYHLVGGFVEGGEHEGVSGNAGGAVTNKVDEVPHGVEEEPPIRVGSKKKQWTKNVGAESKNGELDMSVRTGSNGQQERERSYLEESSAEESGPERVPQRDTFLQAQQSYASGEPSDSIYAAGGRLPPSMGLHPAWPLLPNSQMVASIPDEVDVPMQNFEWNGPPMDGSGLQDQSQGTSQGANDYTAMQDFFESLGIPNLPGGIGDIFGMSTNRFEGPPESAGLTILSSASNPNMFARTSVAASNGSAADPTVVGMRTFGDGNDALRNPPLFTPREQEEDIKPRLGNDAFDLDQRNGEANPDGKATYMASGEPLLGKVSKAEKYLLAAADQASGTRDERLAQVIKAKYDAGLLKPYDYSRSYARFYRWMEKNVSATTKQAILRPLSVFRPAFRAIAQSLSDIDLVFVEEAFERLMLDYDRVFSAIHTPSCLWRRTGEIYKANKEFSVLTGIPTPWLRGGRVGIYQLMTEESLLRYYELLGSMAFDSGRRSVNTTCTLRIPAYLTRSMNPQTPLFGPTGTGNPTIPMQTTSSSVPSASPAQLATPLVSPTPGKATPMHVGHLGGPSGLNSEPGTARAAEYSTVKCCFSFTIRRDSWGIPTAIIGNWIPV